MSVKTQGNQWCERCGKAVMAVKSTHRLRSITAAAMIPFTVGVSGFAAKRDPYVCAGCGGPVRALPKPAATAAKREAEQFRGALLIALIVVAILVHLLSSIS